MLWDHVAETWQMLSNRVWISADADAHAHVRRQKVSVSTAESRERDAAGSGDLASQTSKLRRHYEAEQSSSNSLHMGS